MSTSIQRIPKQVTKAPSGAAVSSMPYHEAAIPLNKSVTAYNMAQNALTEWSHSMKQAQRARREGDRQTAVFLLNDAAEYRRIYLAFCNAVDVMGGL